MTSNINITFDANVVYAPYIPLSTTISLNMKPIPKWQHIGNDMRFGRVYQIRDNEIISWIQSQPIHTWKPYTIEERNFLEMPVEFMLGESYVFTEEMESWFKLRWS